MAAQDALRDEEIHNAEDGQQGKHHADKQVEHAWRAHAGRELNKEAAERLKVAQHDDGRDCDRLEHDVDGIVEQHGEQDALAAEQVADGAGRIRSAARTPRPAPQRAERAGRCPSR